MSRQKGDAHEAHGAYVRLAPISRRMLGYSLREAESQSLGVSMSKVGRNDPCPCNSGRKYKYCCINKEIRQRIVPATKGIHGPNSPETIDLTNDWMNFASGLDRSLHYFCKDNGIYFFSSVVTVGKMEELTAALSAGMLTKTAMIEHYIEVTKEELVVAWIEDACGNFPSFGPRRKILLDAVSAHYEGRYTLSVPVLFAQLEGVLRTIGKIDPRDDFKATIKRDWDSRMLFGMSESASMLNAFLSRLYEGRRGVDEFNRNPVLHGANVTYNTEENSLILILTLLEIRNFLWFEKNTVPIV